MMGLAVSVIVGVLVLFCFLILTLRGWQKAPTSSLSVTNLCNALDLRGLAFGNVDVLLSEKDYLILRSWAGLSKVARQFRGDRRRIVLMWLGSLQEDVGTLWKFHRFLVRNGVPASVREEVHIAATATLALLILSSFKVSVVVAGPFSVRKLSAIARLPVQRASNLCAHLVSKMPPSRWAEVERKWAEGLA